MGKRCTRIVEIEKSVATAVTPSERVLAIAAMFGLGVDDEREMQLVPRCSVPLPAGGVVFITGPSGGGKTTILKLIAQRAAAEGMPVIDADALRDTAPAEQPLVDAFDLPIERVSSLLAMAGLGDAFVMLRLPSELSDGQRYRFRLAQMMAMADAQQDGAIILADEFGATLDRLTAAIIARNVCRWVRRTQHTFLCATTHDDLLEPLQPDVLVYKNLGDEVRVIEPAASTEQHDGEDSRKAHA